MIDDPHRKAHPDEKGTERWKKWKFADSNFHYRKAHPDEKGTESDLVEDSDNSVTVGIARPIPMKRELKGKLWRHDHPAGH